MKEEEGPAALQTEYKYPPNPTLHGLVVEEWDFDPDDDPGFCEPF